MMMALVLGIAARRLPRNHFIACCIHPPPSELQVSPYFSLTFHQTLHVPSSSSNNNNNNGAHFTALPHSSLLYHPVDFDKNPDVNHEPLDPGAFELVEGVKKCPTQEEALAFLGSFILSRPPPPPPSGNFACSLIWALRDDWRRAHLVFRWCEEQGCLDGKAWDLMIWVLCNHRKFKVAWCLIRELHKLSGDTGNAAPIMMDRYAAANYPTKAIRTFHMMEKFRICVDVKAFYALLNALCRYGNIEEAEEQMLLNKRYFPLATESFNIILNGWCNTSVDIFEAKRVWKRMSEYCITPDVTSYTCMISCFSKVRNLFDSLRLYDEMKRRGWVPGLEVYNSLIYVLTHENCLNEALKVLDKMKETGFQPDSNTYNSLILPLCEAKKLEEARTILTTMIREGISPNTETYHAFLKGGSSLEVTFEVVNRMAEAGCGPNGDTFLIILGKFFELKQSENALKIWLGMQKYEVVPGSAHYAAMIEGLATCGLLDKAREFHAEMVSHGFMDDPKLKLLVKKTAQGKKGKRDGQARRVKRVRTTNHSKGSRFRGKIAQKPI